MPRVASSAGHGGRPPQPIYEAAFGGVADLAHLRADVRDLLLLRGRTEAHVRAVALVLSELATNALLHGAPPYRVSVELDAHHTVVAVRDDDNHTHVLPRTPAEADGGYGLHLIDAIASSWTARADADAKWVSASIADSSGL
jgi:two-component sensor histidine kinase